MNREIKFRAWDKKNKTMFNPGFFELRQEIDGGFFGFVYGNNNELIELELIEFTGIYHNNEELYEGDILKIGNHSKQIKWSKKTCGFIGLYDLLGYELLDHPNAIRVGNIYENPELLSTN